MIASFESQYLELLRDLLALGEAHQQNRTGVSTVGFFGQTLRSDLQAEFPLLTTKKVHLRSVVVELMWFLRGRSDVQWLQDRGVTIWDEWATEEQCKKFYRPAGELGPVYGKQWRDFGWQTNGGEGIDQIDWLLNEVRTNPTSRRLLVTAWNPRDVGSVSLPPCHWAFQVKVDQHRKGAGGKPLLHLMFQMRSCDVFLGLPFNMASYALLAHWIAAATGCEPGELTCVIGDAHLYQNHTTQALEQLCRAPKKAPTVRLDMPLASEITKREMTTHEWVEALTLGSVLVAGYDPHPPIKAPVAASVDF